MLSVIPPPSRFMTALFAFLVLAVFGLRLQAQDAKGSNDTHYVDDWTHHHVVFSDPGTEQDALDKDWKDRWSHAHDRWLATIHDPRYVNQQRKRNSSGKSFDHSEKDGEGWHSDPWDRGRKGHDGGGDNPPSKSDALKIDWNSPMIAAGEVQPNMFPAKFSFSTTTASCNDFVVYPTGVAGAATAATIAAYSNLYTGGCSGTVPGVSWAFNTGTGYSVTTSPIIVSDATGSQVAFIQSNGGGAQLVLLKWAASPATITTAKGSVSSSSTQVTLTTGITAADIGMQISDTSRACIPANDTIAAFSGTTVTLATATTAGCGTHAGDSLTLTAQSLAVPGVAPTAASAALYRSCTAPCMYTVSLGADDTYSSPYYDYVADDAIFVGDDTGRLHKITGVFYGTTIAEDTGWPVTLNAAALTTSPDYDNTSGYVFVGNTAGVLYSVGTGNVGTTNASIHGTSSDLGDTIIDAPIVDSTAGKVYAFVTTTNGASHTLTGCAVTDFTATITCTGSGSFSSADVGATIASTNGTLNGETITADTSATVATLSATDFAGNITGASITLTDLGSNAVYQFATSFTSGTGTVADIGSGGTGFYLLDGAFDNVYYSSTGGTAGDLWVVGNTGDGGSTGATLYRIPIGAGSAMGTPVAAISGLTDNAAAHEPWPSPITEYCNQTSVGTPCSASAGSTTGGTDYIYFSVDRLETTAGACTNASGQGCLLGYSINTPTSAPTRVGSAEFTTVGSPGCWTTSGISIDNSVPSGTLAGASQIYFIALNGNSAGGPNGQTSASCGTLSTSHTPSAMQESQSAP